MAAFTPVFAIIYVVWLLAGTYYFGEAVRWFFDIRSLWPLFFILPLTFILAQIIPFGSTFLVGVTFYYLAFVLDWNLFAAILFVCPGFIGALLGLMGAGVDTLIEKYRRTRQ